MRNARLAEKDRDRVIGLVGIKRWKGIIYCTRRTNYSRLWYIRRIIFNHCPLWRGCTQLRRCQTFSIRLIRTRILITRWLILYAHAAAVILYVYIGLLIRTYVCSSSGHILLEYPRRRSASHRQTVNNWLLKSYYLSILLWLKVESVGGRASAIVLNDLFHLGRYTRSDVGRSFVSTTILMTDVCTSFGI